MIENSTQGLTLLDPDHEVVVTGEERHQGALLPWAPRGGGRPRRVAVDAVRGNLRAAVEGVSTRS